MSLTGISCSLQSSFVLFSSLITESEYLTVLFSIIKFHLLEVEKFSLKKIPIQKNQSIR